MNEMILESASQTRRLSARVLTALTIVAMVAAAVFAGYQQVFSTFVDYDDEGYVMMSLYNVLQGRPLYDETYTQYGPAFFQIHSGLHQILNLPVTHDVVRTKALIQWIAVCLICFGTVYRLTRSLSLSIAGFTAVFCLLERFCVEPGHPQDIAALAVASTLFLSTLVCGETAKGWFSRNNAIFALLAVIVSVIGLTKANIGVLLFLGVVTTLLMTTEKNRVFEFLTPRVLLAGFALPLFLIARYWSIQQAVLLPIAAAASIGLTACIRQHVKIHVSTTVQGFIVFTGTTMLTVAAILTFAWLGGTSPEGMLNGILLQHLGFAGSFFSAPPLTPLIIPATVVVGLLAIASLRHGYWALTVLRCCAIGLITALLIQFFFETATPSGGGYEGRMHTRTLTSFAPLLCWILLFPGFGFRQRVTQTLGQRQAFARLMLCMVAAFQLLISYPIPGSQIAMGSFPLVIVLLVAISDFIQTDLPFLFKPLRLHRKRTAITGLLVVLSIMTLAYRDVSLWQRRQSFVPLDLPGARLLRLPAEEVLKYQQLTRFLRAHADAFVFRESTQNCLYFWSEIEPPTAINATIWPYMLDARQQQQTVDRLTEIDRLIVVSSYSRSQLPETAAPLAEYISQQFQPTVTVAGYQIWTRKNRRDAGPMPETGPKISGSQGRSGRSSNYSTDVVDAATRSIAQ